MTAQAFFEELQRLIYLYPKPPLKIENSEDCELSDQITYSKNLRRCFDCHNCSDCVYMYDSYQAANCVDGDYVVESQLCYECVDIYKCFNCTYVEKADATRDADYCYDLTGCSNVFGCVYLVNKSYCIFNRQLTEAGYKQKVAIYKKWPPEKVLAIVDTLKKQFPLTQTKGAHNENSDYGNYVYYSKNCYLCFDTARSENCAYSYDIASNKMCMDMTHSGDETELSYQCIGTDHLFNCDYVFYSNYCRDCSYVFNSCNINDCFGCVGLYHKKYCFLNRQLTKEQYEKAVSGMRAKLQESDYNWGSLVF